MRSICRIYHPMVLGAWVVLDLFARNTADVTANEIILPLIAVPVLALVGTLLVLAVLKKPDHSGLIASLTLVAFFSYGLFFSYANGWAESLGIEALAGPRYTVRNRYLLLALAIFVAVSVILIARLRKDLSGVTRSVNLVSLVLLLFTAARIMFSTVSSNDSPDIAASDRVDRPAASVDSSPDIYYLIFDRYPSQSSLQTVYEFDNQSFLQQLETRDFSINNDSRCNYPSSLASLYATLNMAYHEESVPSSTLSYNFRRGHVVGHELLSRGYTYFHVGGWYVPTRENRLAAVNSFSQNAPPGMSEFHVALLQNTPLYPFLKLESQQSQRHAEIIQSQFSALEKVAKRQGPKFVFAHILLPHPPFVFDRDGKRVEKLDSKAAFLNQLHYTNTRITQLVDVLRAESSAEPVIILQADEGPYLRGNDRQQPMATQYQIRAGILNAWHVPAEFRDKLQVPASSINTFPTLMNLLFEQDYALLPDHFYAWKSLLEHPHEPVSVYHFQEISFRTDDQ